MITKALAGAPAGGARYPRQVRRTAGDASTTRPRDPIPLAVRLPYDWDGILGFLAARATPGVESVSAAGYRRTVSVRGRTGVIAVSRPDGAVFLHVTVPGSDRRTTAEIVTRVGAVFDVAADPHRIGARFAGDPLLAPLIARHPGMRVPGAWDGFELAVRAVLGQQVSVRAATTLAGRLAAGFGTPVADPGGLSRLFPAPWELAEAPLENVGVMPARARTIRALAQQVASGSLVLARGRDARRTVAALERLPGIGAWTAEYIAMRALGDADAFPSGDLVLRRVAGDATARALERRAEAWRPWRAYAALLLWRAAVMSAGRSAGRTGS